MHPKNKHQDRYDLKKLAEESPDLKNFCFMNPSGLETIDFSDPKAVKALNRALLRHDYHIVFWNLSDEFLCPPIPGRADLIHYASDLFPAGKKLHVLDVGVGANCIYPLLGIKEYGWTFIGTDTSKKALKNAQLIVDNNQLAHLVKLRHQRDKTKIFTSMIHENERFDLTICNPPFHESIEEALKGSNRKWKNLGKKELSGKLNFGGQDHELWYPGGEKAFITKMIKESAHFSSQVNWFTSLVSKEKNLTPLGKLLKELKATVQVKDMEQGQKMSRLLCWTFPNEKGRPPLRALPE
jgi:23S rRNA (adenine1618-N6)-methyltransferase